MARFSDRRGLHDVAVHLCDLSGGRFSLCQVFRESTSLQFNLFTSQTKQVSCSCFSCSNFPVSRYPVKRVSQVSRQEQSITTAFNSVVCFLNKSELFIGQWFSTGS